MNEPGSESEAARRWLILSVLAPQRGEEILLVDALRRLGAHAVEREAERILAWFPGPASVDDLVRRARTMVRASTTLTDPAIAWRWESHAAWAARWTRDVGPRQVTDRIMVVPIDAPVDAPVDADAGARPDRILIRLDPAAAFGTAEHPSTCAGLRFLEALVRPADRLADIGTGTGILAIAAARLGAAAVLALEADGGACAAARTNVALNDVADRVEVRHLRVTAGDLGRLGPFQGIAANLEAAALRPLLPALASALVEGGWLVLAGLLRTERAEVVNAVEATGLSLRDESVEGGWWAGWVGNVASG